MVRGYITGDVSLTKLVDPSPFLSLLLPTTGSIPPKAPTLFKKMVNHGLINPSETISGSQHLSLWGHLRCLSQWRGTHAEARLSAVPVRFHEEDEAGSHTRCLL